MAKLGMALQFGVLAGSISGPRVSSAQEAEARVVISALKVVKSYKLTKVQVLCDSLKVVQSLKEDHDWAIDSILLDTLARGGSFEFVDFSHVSRMCNT